MPSQLTRFYVLHDVCPNSCVEYLPHRGWPNSGWTQIEHDRCPAKVDPLWEVIYTTASSDLATIKEADWYIDMPGSQEFRNVLSQYIKRGRT